MWFWQTKSSLGCVWNFIIHHLHMYSLRYVNSSLANTANILVQYNKEILTLNCLDIINSRPCSFHGYHPCMEISELKWWLVFWILWFFLLNFAYFLLNFTTSCTIWSYLFCHGDLIKKTQILNFWKPENSKIGAPCIPPISFHPHPLNTRSTRIQDSLYTTTLR